MFLFCIFVIVNYVSYADSSVIKRSCNSNKICNDAPGEDVSTSLIQRKTKSLNKIADNERAERSQNLKVNLFENGLSDDILSYKQNAYGRNMKCVPPNSKSSSTSIETSTLKTKQKWPLGEGLFTLDDIIEENGYENFDFRNLFSKVRKQNVSTTETTSENDNLNDVEQQDNLKDKVLDLRSLSHFNVLQSPQNHLGPHVTEHNHNCSRIFMNTHKPEIIFPYNWNYNTGFTASYSLIPFYLPYQSYYHNLPNIFVENTPPLLDDDSDYDDDNDEDEIHYKESTKSRKRKEKKVKVVSIDYDSKTHSTTVQKNVLEDSSNELLEDLMKIISISSSKIKNCFCLNSSNDTSSVHVTFLRLTFIVHFCIKYIVLHVF